jgi:hypothetical protein
LATVRAELGEFGAVVDGKPIESGELVEIRSPYDGSLVALANRASPADVEHAIASAVEAFASTRYLPAWRRSEVLEPVSEMIFARRDELARTIALEAGKPTTTARLDGDGPAARRGRPVELLTFTGSPPVGWELKSVGTGREGLRYAIEEMTELSS